MRVLLGEPMLNISEIKKKQEPISFDHYLEIKKSLIERDPSIIDIKDVHVVGTVSYDDGLYHLNYQLSYSLTLPSSRSMEPVERLENQSIQEFFAEEGAVKDMGDKIDESLVLILEDDSIDLEVSAIDNILLSIPLQILTDKELESDEMPSGNDWEVLTEDQFQALQAEKKKGNNPFASLDGLFDE